MAAPQTSFSKGGISQGTAHEHKPCLQHNIAKEGIAQHQFSTALYCIKQHCPHCTQHSAIQHTLCLVVRRINTVQYLPYSTKPLLLTASPMAFTVGCSVSHVAFLLATGRPSAASLSRIFRSFCTANALLCYKPWSSVIDLSCLVVYS